MSTDLVSASTANRPARSPARILIDVFELYTQMTGAEAGSDAAAFILRLFTGLWNEHRCCCLCGAALPRRRWTAAIRPLSWLPALSPVSMPSLQYAAVAKVQRSQAKCCRTLRHSTRIKQGIVLSDNKKKQTCKPSAWNRLPVFCTSTNAQPESWLHPASYLGKNRTSLGIS